MKNFILAVENVPKPMLIAEAVLIVLIIGVVAIRFFIIRSKPAYLKKLPRTVYDDETIHLLFNCYKAADSIEGMLHLAVKEWGLHPFVFHIDAGWNLPVTEKNIRQLTEKLGVELHIEKMDWEEMREMQLALKMPIRESLYRMVEIGSLI